MADLSTLARPYAKAAFDFAKEQDSVGEWQKYLEAVSTIVNDKSFQAYLHNPAIKGTTKVATLQDIYRQSFAVGNTEDNSTVFSTMLAAIDSSHPATQAPSGQMSTEFVNFLTQLSEQDRLALLPNITERFEILQASDAQQAHAYVTSAYPLTPAQELILENRLKNMVGSNVIVHVGIDPSLMAGVTIKIGDKLIDDSVRGKLKQLKTQLTA